MSLANYLLVFVAGLIAAFGTALGTVPLFFLEDISDWLDVSLWGFAGGLMASASVFGLLFEAYRKHATFLQVGAGVVAGVLLVVVAHHIIEGIEYRPKDIAEGDFQTILTVFMVLLVHSFPEGIAIGVSFAGLDTATGIHLGGFTVPIIAIIMTLTLAFHNMPEGVAVGVPLNHEESVGNGRMFGAAFFTSVPQPIGAVIAFYFIQLAEAFLGFGYGFAAGAMVYLVVDDIIPEGLEAGEDLPNRGLHYLGSGFAIGVAIMVPLLFIL